MNNAKRKTSKIRYYRLLHALYKRVDNWVSAKGLRYAGWTRITKREYYKSPPALRLLDNIKDGTK